MKAGVLAAGNGARLCNAADPLKPLVRVAGRSLIEHVLHSLGAAGADEVTVIINEDSLAVREQVNARAWPFALRWIVETTPTSMHSFLRLVETLAADGAPGPFLISTVDTIAPPEMFARFYAQACLDDEAAVTLALTSTIDDEKPLFVRCHSISARVEAVGESASDSNLVTAGIYAVRPTILQEAGAARREGLQALRAFFGRLLESGYSMRGLEIGETVDVDFAADVAKAEALLEEMSA